jgi:hypothetical protein
VDIAQQESHLVGTTIGEQYRGTELGRLWYLNYGEHCVLGILSYFGKRGAGYRAFTNPVLDTTNTGYIAVFQVLRLLVSNATRTMHGKQAHIIQSHTSEDQSFHSLNVRLGVC